VLVTLDTSKADKSPLNELAAVNIKPMFVTVDTFQDTFNVEEQGCKSKHVINTCY
jgi:hypothetical protein